MSASVHAKVTLMVINVIPDCTPHFDAIQAGHHRKYSGLQRHAQRCHPEVLPLLPERLIPANGIGHSWSTEQSPIYHVDVAGSYSCGPDRDCPGAFDGLHPNALGNYEIASAFSETLGTSYHQLHTTAAA